MKKIIMILVMILVCTASVFASDTEVQINGKIIDFKDNNGNVVKAQIINSRTMVPLRKIFESLGCEVLWNDETKTVTGIKGDTSIILQINNNIAYRIVNGVKEEIKLDSCPIIYQDRTLVPLRFIAESLGKQVGWDNDKKTAIIIDYEYFVNKLNNNAPSIVKFLNRNVSEYGIIVSHNYYDLSNSSNDTNMAWNIKESGQDNISLKISGNDELAKEIINEKWNDLNLSILKVEDGIVIKSNNQVFNKMFNVSSDGLSKSYKDLKLSNNQTESLEGFFRSWANIEESNLDINTFSKLNVDFNKLLDLFKTTNGFSSSVNITFDSYHLEYFDLAKLDDFLSCVEYQNLLNIINRVFFKFEIERDVLLFDNNNILVTINANENSMKITVEMSNEYNEKDVYMFELK